MRQEQRKIKDGNICKVNREGCLEYQGQQRGEDDGASAKLVNLDVRFAADIECRVLLLITGGGVRAPGAEGCTSAGCSSLFVSRARREGRTSTSSTRSRLAAALTRIFFNR